MGRSCPQTDLIMKDGFMIIAQVAYFGGCRETVTQLHQHGRTQGRISGLFCWQLIDSSVNCTQNRVGVVVG